MAMLAQTPPPLKRLFVRLDFAPHPKTGSLSRFLDTWTRIRGMSIAPSSDEFLAAERDHRLPRGFIFQATGPRDYRLDAAEPSLQDLLGGLRSGSRLAAAENRRNAVRLRRLFDAVCSAGEPILAEIDVSRPWHNRELVEVVAAPLSDDGRHVTGIVGDFNVRPFGQVTSSHLITPSNVHEQGPILFALGASQAFGQTVADQLGSPLASLEERAFEDGEQKIRSLVNVRNRDVYVLHSLHGDAEQTPNDKLCRLLFFIASLKDAAARQVTAVVPYLCYGRKDRQTKSRDPITTRYVAQLFEAVGTDRMITMDAHNVVAYQNAFRCDTEHLEAASAFLGHFGAKVGTDPVAVVSPDLGGAKRAEAFREHLEAALGRSVDKAFMDKHRSMGKVTGEIFAGDVAGRTAIIIDDLISTGATMARVAAACRAHGAKRVLVAATHGLFAGDLTALEREDAIEEIVVTNTISPIASAAHADPRVTVLDVSGLFAEAIKRCHAGGSIGDLLGRAEARASAGG